MHAHQQEFDEFEDEDWGEEADPLQSQYWRDDWDLDDVRSFLQFFWCMSSFIDECDFDQTSCPPKDLVRARRIVYVRLRERQREEGGGEKKEREREPHTQKDGESERGSKSGSERERKRIRDRRERDIYRENFMTGVAARESRSHKVVEREREREGGGEGEREPESKRERARDSERQ